MSDQSTDEAEEKIEYQTMANFLESTPPNRNIYISDLSVPTYMGGGMQAKIQTPEIQLHCDNENCNGTRFFRCASGAGKNLERKHYNFFYVTYRCSNCQQVIKTFSLAAKVDTDEEPTGQCYKFGELPTYGPPVSPKLIKLIGPDKDEFLMGRRCEVQGLGVGSFIYYRRVVVNQTNRILEEVIKVSEKIGAPQDKIETLKKAVGETQFSRALGMAKDSMPESLLIDGHNPILLLHRALSKGVHDLSDQRCLELASSVRIVLGNLSERLSQALKDEAELNKALSSLMSSQKD